MSETKAYVNNDTGQIVSAEARDSIMMLIKLLFRFDVVDEEQAIKIASKFRILFV